MKRYYPIMDDIEKFVEMKLKEYAESRKGKVSTRELNAYAQKIMSAWNSKVARKYPLEEMDEEEKIELFKSIRIDS